MVLELGLVALQIVTISNLKTNMAEKEQAEINKNNAAAQAQAPAEAPPAGGAPLDMMAA